ncbi:MAG: hypothetical protein UR54_C0014G0007 [Candidatus Roizmanbacteria bacterium GW2011_GWA2_34_18]|uniref:Glycosyltransferase RgtA/B/C/D-like domain-containing protein n=1 Tax=Candidatus Roizmanbacteria bacterium GW2011_GWA2_34_18 TaxID=1618477 RepID=A0A0G0ATT9_9BACT|nr:MAG: hypothetical protein UR54_C0014G0007 [Candidatus Roizmanbacteria bacterium GW2011_GWA2_34_18]
MKKILSQIIKSKTFLPFIFFTFIFTVYFSSSVGLINSGDTPQYFTTEALITKKNIDIKSFNNDPHFFVYPDVYEDNGRLLSLRGIVFSFIMIPLHLFSNFIKNIFSINIFSPILKVPNFRYELAITSFFSVFSVLGLYLIFKLIKKVVKNDSVSYISVFLLSFGTYIWKYGNSYIRQGLVILILSFCTYSLYSFLNSKKRFWLISFFIMIVLSYGIDMFLFISLAFFSVIFLIYLLIKKIYPFRKILSSLFFPTLFILFIFFCNYINYGNILSNQTHQQQINKKHIIKKQYLFSTPIFPTINHVLFGFGKISLSSFKNFKMLDSEYIKTMSVDYAKKYNFFGIFIVSPFLFFSLFYLYKIFFLKVSNNIYVINLFCFFVFTLGIILNTKVLVFWGGNQYDIRYFYPYVILLGLPLSLSLQEIIKSKNRLFKIILEFLFLLSAIFSLLMGWLGVINMYKPALTGERRIWMEIYDLKTQFFNHSFKDYLDATFMNRENFWIPIALSIMFFLIYQLVIFLIRRIKRRDYHGYFHH